MHEYAIIPRPASIQYQSGSFQCSGVPQIAPQNASSGGADNSGDAAAFFETEARVFAGQLQQCFGESAADGPGLVHLRKTDSNAAAESYRMEILPGEIRLYAGAGAGMFRALQTLRQLLLSGYSGVTTGIPCGTIEDHPRFPWRGFMLDCSRYFYSIEFIKRLLDALSLQHINVFHWHLTDDQGWRLPVSTYPQLAETGSQRYDRRRHCVTGGYYTEAEIRDIVSFAAGRHIEVVPEVDFPGHASALLAAYPELGCTGGPYQVEDRFGVFDDVLCAGNDRIFPLIESVFDTLAALFPSQYVHIGGDEVRFTRWAECPKCQQRCAELKLAAPGDMQGWITARLARMLRQRGKTAIAWDEVLENSNVFPLPEDLVVMSWRGSEGGIKAAAQGHRVIMSPNNGGCYLDYRHADSPEEPGQPYLSTIAQGYSLNPAPPEMDEAAAALVLGGQGNLWSELIYAGKIAEYMTFPRICAIAEALWSSTKNFADFSKRLTSHQNRLDLLGVLQYRGQ